MLNKQLYKTYMGCLYGVVIPYIENTVYSTNKYSCVRRVHTLYISYNTDDVVLKKIFSIMLQARGEISLTSNANCVCTSFI